MSKKTTIILITIIALILIGGGVYLWQSQEKESSLESMDYIQIKDTPEGKIVENTKEGISMKVPDGWEVQLPTNEQEPISFYSSERVPAVGVIGEEEWQMCKIEASTDKRTINIEDLKKELESDVNKWYTVELNTYEIIEIDNYQALKNTFQAQETGYSIAVYIPTAEYLYSFAVYPSYPYFQYEEKCSQEFNEFLKTVSIK